MSDMIKEMETKQIINQAVALDRQIKASKRSLDIYKAELQSRGLQMMDDQNIKYVKYYGDDGTASITDSASMDVLNIDKLQDLLSEGVFKAKVKESTETKYKFDVKLEKALKAIFTGDYDLSISLDEFMDQMSIHPDPAQRKLLLKKLKGDYEKDRAILISVFGLDESQAPDFDVELYYIYRIKNAELIKAFLPEEGLDVMIEAIKKCIIVDSKTSITLDYSEEDA